LVESGQINIKTIRDQIWAEVQKIKEVLDSDDRVHGVISLGSYKPKKVRKPIIQVDITPGAKYKPEQIGSSFYGHTYADITQNGINLVEKVTYMRNQILGIRKNIKFD